ncbi:MAG: homogentisate 1,2-dioxygenase, partial [Ginsengibacter sp.]
MPHYQQSGSFPHKRHTQFRKPGGDLYSEQLFSTEGFSSDSSLLYHTHPPTQIIKTEKPHSVMPEVAEEKMLQHRSFQGFRIKSHKDYLKSRKPILINNDCHISLAAPSQGMRTYFYKNADADEILFIHEGAGKLKTLYGELPFSYGDYLVLPRGTIYQVEFESEQNRMFIVESFSPVRYPKRYVSKFGQLMENAPFCERDIRVPQNLQTHDEKGDFLIMIKK